MQKFAITIFCLIALGTMLAMSIKSESIAGHLGRAEGFSYPVMPVDELTAIANGAPNRSFNAF